MQTLDRMTRHERFEDVLKKLENIELNLGNHEVKDETQLNQSKASNSSTLLQVILDMPSATSDFHGWVEPSGRLCRRFVWTVLCPLHLWIINTFRCPCGEHLGYIVGASFFHLRWMLLDEQF